MVDTLELAVALCDDIVEASAHAPVAAWHWGPALFGFALGELERHLGEPRYRDWLTRYADHYLEHTPPVHSADTVAPALVTFHLQQATGDARYAALTDRVVDYIEHAPRLVGDAVNHLGTSGWGRVYPKSIWVDSLMMFSVFPARYGATTGRRELVDIAARQPRQYADLMFDPAEHLWYHSWWKKSWHTAEGPFPGKGLYWARGNGWVVAALPMILDAIGAGHPEAPRIRELLAQTSSAMMACERPDRTWNTLLHGRRRNYRELSTTALVAGGWLHAARQGYLDEAYLARGRASLQAVARTLRKDRDGRWELPEISGPTVPVPVVPQLGYEIIRTSANQPYGVAAFVLAAINDDRLRQV